MQGAGGLALALSDRIRAPTGTDHDINDLRRDVYCVLGVPIDATDMAATLRKIDKASANAEPTLISTANLNFLANSLADPEFRQSLLLSDLCTADGMPVVWIARLLGLPIRDRIAGSDILESLRATTSSRKQRVFFFGGANGIADAARRILNAENAGLTCVGTLNPGHGTIDDMSSEAIIAAINASNADFLVVALGASKGQAWLLRNHLRLRVPVRAHLGAAINFQAGCLKRAPRAIRNMGLEWLWRIKEEPHLWVRYWHDGRMLLRVLLTRILPLACRARFQRRHGAQELNVGLRRTEDSVVLQVSGDATTPYIGHAIGRFQQALVLAAPLVILDFAAVRDIDQRFFGLMLMLRKSLQRRGTTLLVVSVSDRVRRLFQLNELEFLLDAR